MPANGNKPLLAGRNEPSLRQIAFNFLWLGATAFGGPPVHIGMFKQRFCEELKWLSDTRFAELFAMANCLPGPSSTQVGFAIGITQKGFVGGLVSGSCFILPGAIVMTALGFASSALKDQMASPGSSANSTAIACSAVGVALVFIAVSGLVKKFVFDTSNVATLGSVCCSVAAICLLVSPPPAWMNPVLIFAGGAVTALFPVASKDLTESHDTGRVGLSAPIAVAIFVGYFVLAGWTITVDTYDKGFVMPFLNAGMFVWGGGPVVLPMLMTYLTPTFIHPTVFLTGIALAEMMPGPVFNMSCFLGVQLALAVGWSWPIGVALCWAGLMGPGIALIFAAVPLWNKVRSLDVYKRALPGLNAAAVGLLVQTVFVVYQTLDTRSKESALGNTATKAICLLAYCAIEMVKVNVLVVVAVFALVGYGVAVVPDMLHQ